MHSIHEAGTNVVQRMLTIHIAAFISPCINVPIVIVVGLCRWERAVGEWDSVGESSAVISKMVN